MSDRGTLLLPKLPEPDNEARAQHYSSIHQILLVGEGDFSFSRSLANSFGSASNICASSLDSYDEVVRKCKKARSNLETLKELGASLLHGVDATKMHLHPDLKSRRFDRIVFNFPHAGFYGRESNALLIGMHRRLVGGFFHCASHMLRANGEVHVSHKNKEPFCDWNLEELACGSSLLLVGRVDFEKDDYPGYENKRGNGSKCDKPFHLGECSTFKFKFSRVAKEMYAEKAKSRNLMSQKSKHSQDVLTPVRSDLRYNLNNNWMRLEDVLDQVRERAVLDQQNSNGRQLQDALFQARPKPVSLDLGNYQNSNCLQLLQHNLLQDRQRQANKVGHSVRNHPYVPESHGRALSGHSELNIQPQSWFDLARRNIVLQRNLIKTVSQDIQRAKTSCKKKKNKAYGR